MSRRLKDVAQAQYSQKEADWAAGMSKEILPSIKEKINTENQIDDEL